MPHATWQAGTTIQGPVYLDANLLVGFVVRGHPLYDKCAALIGEILASQLTIFVSLLAVQEALWAIAHLSYVELSHQRPDHFSQSLYKRWLDRIISAHGARLTAIGSMIHAWSEAGVPVEVVPKETAPFIESLELTPEYMRQLKLTPADAAHLAVAKTHAKTLATADQPLARASGNVDLGGLEVLLVTAR